MSGRVAYMRGIGRVLTVLALMAVLATAHALQISGRVVRFDRGAAGLTVYFNGYGGVTDQGGFFSINVPGTGCYDVQIFSADTPVYRVQLCVTSSNAGSLLIVIP